MSQRWLKREGETWVKEGIISPKQLEQITQRYTQQNQVTQILPILAGVLVGLGILTWVAANWDGIQTGLRIVILLVAMVSFYLTGSHQIEQGHLHTGVSLIGLGVITFGGSMILLSQMYHMIAYGVQMFILWSLAALFSLFLYRHPALFILATGIITFSQGYSVESFESFSYVSAALFLLGLGWYAHQQENRWYTWVLAWGAGLQTFFFLDVFKFPLLWLLPFVLGWYVLGDWMKDIRWKNSLKAMALSVAFLYGLILTYSIPGTDWGPSLPDSFFFLSVLLSLLILSLFIKIQNGKWREASDWILFLPIFYLTGPLTENMHTAVYLLVLLVYALTVLLRGYTLGSRYQANWGIALFLLTTTQAYFNLAWDFMPKSLLFLCGGLLLFGLNSLLQRMKKERLSKGG